MKTYYRESTLKHQVIPGRANRVSPNHALLGTVLYDFIIPPSSPLISPSFSSLKQTKQWTVRLMTSASNTLCLLLCVFLQLGSLATLGSDTEERSGNKETRSYFWTLLPCPAVIYLTFCVFVESLLWQKVTLVEEVQCMSTGGK